MSKSNDNKAYLQKVRQIDLDIEKAINNKKWTEVAKLNADKVKFKKLIDESQ